MQTLRIQFGEAFMYSFRFTIPAISIVGIFLVITMNGACQGERVGLRTPLAPRCEDTRGRNAAGLTKKVCFFYSYTVPAGFCIVMSIHNVLYYTGNCWYLLCFFIVHVHPYFTVETK